MLLDFLRPALPTRWCIIKGLDLIVPIILISLEIFLNLLAIGTVINGTLLVLIVLLPLTIILCFLWWPALALIFFLIKFSTLREYTQRQISKFFSYLLYKYQGRYRKSCWNVIYSLFSFSLPASITAQNCGFALITNTGESLSDDLRNKLEPSERENLFQM